MQLVDMGQKQTRYTVPTGEACSRVDVSQDESVLILLQHCRDIKQQEARFRLVSLLLLLGCVSFFIFLQLQEKSGSITPKSAEPSSPAYSKQECPSADSPSISDRPLPFALSSVRDPRPNGSGYMKWKGLNNEPARDGIQIPESGYYFVYVRITFRCQNKDMDLKDFSDFSLILQKFIDEYGSRDLTTAADSVRCKPEALRTLSVGQLFQLDEGNQVKVLVTGGEDMIISSYFGAFLVHK